MIPVVVAAYNEGPRVGAVVRTLVSSRLFSSVIVVDDGSKDDTADQARAAGAQVVVQPKNAGKAQAMKKGWEVSGRGDVAFFDADLVGLTTDHCKALLRGYLAGYDQVCGLRDYSKVAAPFQLFGPIITGERIVRKRVLERVPWDCWQGFDIETAINASCDVQGGKTALIFLKNMNHTAKAKKRGFLSGMFQDFKMFRRIRAVRNGLNGNCVSSCKGF